MAKRKGPVDFLILFSIIVLTVLGMIMVFSASMYNAGVDYNDSFYYFTKQVIYGVLGFVLLFVIMNLNYKIIKKFAPIVFFGCLFLLTIVLIPGIGVEVGGARRWIDLGGLGTLQPSEFMKIGLVLYLSYSFEKKGELIRTFKHGFLQYCLIALVVCGLIALQPNLSTAAITAGLIMGMMFMAGVNLKYLSVLFGAGVAGAIGMIVFTPWRMARMFAYLDPWANATDSGWQTIQSLMALGSGGIFGQGLGNGKAKLMFMPEPQNDFIFAHIGEELGLIGALLILFFYLLIIWRCIRISLSAPDVFSSLFAGGMGMLLGAQVFINVAVVTNLIPVTGMPLPFISAGSSSLISLMCGMAVVLNISKYCDL